MLKIGILTTIQKKLIDTWQHNETSYILLILYKLTARYLPNTRISCRSSDRLGKVSIAWIDEIGKDAIRRKTVIWDIRAK